MSVEDVLGRRAEMLANNDNYKRLLDKVRKNGKYNDAMKIADISGRTLADAIQPEFVNLEEIAYQDANAIVKPCLIQQHDELAEITSAIQSQLNASAGINLQPIVAEIDNDAIHNLIYKLCGGDLEITKFVIEGNTMQAFARNDVIRQMQANVDFQQNAGLHCMMTRRSATFCCDWCESVSGTFEKGKEPKYFWAMHHDCNCYIDYMPSKRPWTRVSFITHEGRKKLEKVTEDL